MKRRKKERKQWVRACVCVCVCLDYVHTNQPLVAHLHSTVYKLKHCAHLIEYARKSSSKRSSFCHELTVFAAKFSVWSVGLCDRIFLFFAMPRWAHTVNQSRMSWLRDREFNKESDVIVFHVWGFRRKIKFNTFFVSFSFSTRSKENFKKMISHFFWRKRRKNSLPQQRRLFEVHSPFSDILSFCDIH